MRSNLDRLTRAAAAFRGDEFRLADSPETADFILFVDSNEPYLGDVYSSPCFRRFADRSYVHNISDAAVPVLPGMYPDLAGPLRRPELQLGAFYLRCFDNKALLADDDESKPTRLFSFVGNVSNAPDVRSRILALNHPEALLLNRSSGLRDDDPDYVPTLRDSNFVICPRGLGPTSWRFYETMMAARVPVIVSDRWVPAREIDWLSFSLRVPESEVESIPAICEATADRAEKMGRRARQQWESHCSLEQAFGWVGRRLRELRAARDGLSFNPTTELVRDLTFRRQMLRYARWRVGKELRARGLR